MNIIDRFIGYCKIDTTSIDEAGVTPSSQIQFDLAHVLVDELKAIGMSNVSLDEHCYVYAKLPATVDGGKKIGFISHMDTSPAVSGTNVKPIIHDYNGGDITLPNGVVIELALNPDLNDYVGQKIITSSGDTLLGCDDKGGVAIVMTAMEYLIAHPEIPHGEISVCFSPDEEIGEGTACFDVPKFDAEFAYTVDGGKLGELEYENFNAASLKYTINGKSFHPGDSKGKMVNAVTIMAELIGMFDSAETPEHTEGYEGFIHFADISGDITKTSAGAIIRDHNMELFEKRKAFAQSVCDFINAKYGEGVCECVIKDSYYNMIEQILPHQHLLDNAKKAFETCGVNTVVVPIRGGTDGARLSFMGLPCPNISTGGHNFHGYQEYVPCESLEKMVEVVVEIAKLYSKGE